MKRGDVLELEIEGYAFEGKGIAKVTRESSGEERKYVIFVEGSYPGDLVKAGLRRVRKSYAEAKVNEVLKPSSERTIAVCSYFGTCGGCKQQDLDYNQQLKYKSEQVKDLFERIGGLDEFEFQEIIPSEKKFFYRNKMEFSFAEKRWLTPEEISTSEEIKHQKFAVGLHIPRIFDKVLDIEECHLQSEESNRILNFTREFFKSRNISVYSTKTHAGYLRHLVIKQAGHGGDLMVNLVTSEDNQELFGNYAEKLGAEVPEITTIVNNISVKKSQVAIGDFEKVYKGSGVIFDRIGDYKFRISPNSFFQTNTLQAENLYNIALQFAEISKEDVVYDLYSGAGTISIFVSGFAKEVYAIETVEAAIQDAHKNLEINSISNVKFIQADLNKSFRYLVRERSIPKPDIIISDPPRSGMNPKTVRDIIELSPKKIVYISCNPATQARDVKLLTEAGYKLIKMRPVDMFPHTFHIENVTLLQK